MSELRIIPVTFNGKRYIVTDHRMQYDWGQVLYFTDLELPDSFEARFSNAPTGESVGQIGSNNRIRIPKQFFESGEPIYCYITLHDEVTDGRTVYTTKVPIKPSSERTEEEPEPEEESIITQAITTLNTAIEKTAQDVASADALVQAASEQADRAEHAAEGVEGYAERAEAAQSASESARDIALEAKVSAQASAATASEKASEAISSATTASQSAITAENASESAGASATASAESASQASASASTASTKAQEASGYASSANTSAQTASQKALEAAQSASTAVQAKTDAETAKQASETAQGLAESARDGAVSAKTVAESARDEAQDIVDGITGKVEQIDSNTERIESLEDDRYKPYVTDTASGSIASFPDGADGIPVKSCIVQIEPVQEGSGDPSPDNVRPITGWTGVEIQHDGTNLFDGEMENGDINQYTGENNGTSSSQYRSKNYIPIRAGSYYFKSPNRTGTVRVFFYDANKSFIYFTAWNVNAVNTFDLERARYIRFRFSTGKVDGDEQISINSPSSVTEYLPYVGQTYPITFPTEAGTVYGGTLDVINGELVVDRYFANVSNVVNKSANERGYFWYCTSGSIGIPIIKGVNAKLISNRFAPFYNVNESTNDGLITFYANGIIRWKEHGEMTLAEYKAYLAENPFELCYELAEPIHYPLTATEIKTLLGQNNVWADTGDVSVEYRADTRLYIEKLTQPEEDDMIADSAISEGRFFMVGNSLYRALANIASGATITVGTNAQRVSLSDALNLVNA